MTGIQRYNIEEVDIVVEDEKGVAVEQAVVEMLGVVALSLTLTAGAVAFMCGIKPVSKKLSLNQLFNQFETLFL